jgi:hypothetical protein
MLQPEVMRTGSILSFEKKPPRKAVQGGLLLDRIFQRDPSQGGCFVEATGAQGCGKTSLLLGFATKIIRQRADEIVLWRESVNAPVQWNKFDGEVQILVEKKYKIKIRRQDDRSIAKEIELHYFEGFEELFSLLRTGCLNVIYFKEGFTWVDLLKQLVMKPGFKSIFWDEYEDLLPEHSSGTQWKKNGEFSNVIKQVRKGGITLVCATQSNSDVDFRVRKKLNLWIYMYGAKLDAQSPVSVGAIHSLRIGSAWIDSGHCLFGQFTFPPFKPKKDIYIVEEC